MTILYAGTRYGKISIMKTKKKMKKVTVVLPTDVLEKALKCSGESIAGAVRKGLELLSASVAYEKLRDLRGKVRVSIDVNSLRDD